MNKIDNRRTRLRERERSHIKEISEEQQYLLENVDKLKRLLLNERKKQISQGKELNIDSYLRGFVEGVRDRKISIHAPIEETYSTYQASNANKYITKIITVDVGQLVNDVVYEVTTNEQIRNEILTSYKEILESKYSNQLSKRGTETAYRYIKSETKRLVDYIAQNIKAKQMEKVGELSPEDIRRFKRVQLIIRQQEKELNSVGLKFSVSIDGSTKSHIKMKHKQTIYIISPSQIINHSKKTYIYKRDEIGRTVGSLKENIHKLKKEGFTEEVFNKVSLLLATSWDLRKTVTDGEGKKY